MWNHKRIYKDFDIYVTFGAGGAPTTLTPQALSTQYTYVAQWTKKYLICMKSIKQLNICHAMVLNNLMFHVKALRPMPYTYSVACQRSRNITMSTVIVCSISCFVFPWKKVTLWYFSLSLEEKDVCRTHLFRKFHFVIFMNKSTFLKYLLRLETRI